MLATRVTLSLAILLVTAGRGEAQSIAARGRARVVGTVVDSATGRPIIRTSICAVVDLGPPDGRVNLCARPDTAGRYVLDSLPAGRLTLSASCSGLRSSPLAQGTLEVVEGEQTRFDVRTSAAGCDMRPFIVRRGLFEGRFTSGFEESTFRPCNDTIRAWAELSWKVVESGPKWPIIKGNDDRPYFVRWRGTLRGPWRYGHMGGWSYEISVDSILGIRRPRRSDCR
jgi:hypothetical protein